MFVLDLSEVEQWVRGHVEPRGRIDVVHSRPWATVVRVPLADGTAWFKACAPVQAFEPRLTAELFRRWPDLVPEVLAHDEERAWLLLADAGRSVGSMDEPPGIWLTALRLYADLQRGESAHVSDHLAHGVPDLRLATLPGRYDELLALDLPIEEDEIRLLRSFRSGFAELCEELASYGVPETIQHDDLHHANLYVNGDQIRVLDWGDSSISHPFASLVVTFRFLEERHELASDDPWFERLRGAYLEPWGAGFGRAVPLAIRLGSFARAIAYVRQREALDREARAWFDVDFSTVLRRAIAHRGQDR